MPFPTIIYILQVYKDLRPTLGDYITGPGGVVNLPQVESESLSECVRENIEKIGGGGDISYLSCVALICFVLLKRYVVL